MVFDFLVLSFDKEFVFEILIQEDFCLSLLWAEGAKSLVRTGVLPSVQMLNWVRM